MKKFVALFLILCISSAEADSRKTFQSGQYEKVYGEIVKELKQPEMKLHPLKWVTNTLFWLYSHQNISQSQLISGLNRLKSQTLSEKLVPPPAEYVKAIEGLTSKKDPWKEIKVQIEFWGKQTEPLFQVNVQRRAWLKVLRAFSHRQMKLSKEPMAWALQLGALDVISGKMESIYIDMVLRSTASTEKQKLKARQLKAKLLNDSNSIQ